jgi:hypothetical protein
MSDDAVQPAGLTAATTATARRSALFDYISSHFYHPDLEALDIILACYRSHYFSGSKPVWLWVLGTSGSGKTEIGIKCVEGLPLIKPVGELTAAALISAKRGQTGILYRLHKLTNGTYTGILTFKDFTSFLSMRREDRGVVVSQLREIADGKWDKDTGEKGSQSWRGKVTLIAACTPALEMAWSIHRNMGDRFITLRWNDADDEATANKAQQNDGLEEEISSRIQSLAQAYMGTPTFSPPPPIPALFVEPLTKIALLSCWLRTPVHRDEYTHKIDDVGPREKPTRMVKALRTLLAGYQTLYERPLLTTDLRVAYRLAMDSVPLRRFRIVDSLTDDQEFSFRDVSELSGTPRATLQRDLDELYEIGVLTVTTRKEDEQERIYVSLTRSFSQHRAHIFGLFSIT